MLLDDGLHVGPLFLLLDCTVVVDEERAAELLSRSFAAFESEGQPTAEGDQVVQFGTVGLTVLARRSPSNDRAVASAVSVGSPCTAKVVWGTKPPNWP